MNSPADDIARLLAATLTPGGDIGGNLPFCINFAAEPDAPDDTITIYDTPGGEPDTDELDEYQIAFQVRIRCKVHAAGYAKHEAIRNLLILPVVPIVAASSKFLFITLTSDIGSLGRDDGNRHILVANYSARRTA